MIPKWEVTGDTIDTVGRRMRSRGGEAGTQVLQAVERILQAVRAEGDIAVRRYTEQFDGQAPASLRLEAEAIRQALAEADPKFIAALERAAANIRAYHERQKRQSFVELKPSGSMIGQRIRPLRRVGLYVPGGTAAYPSSVLMNAIPARVAGVPEIVMVTPPAKGGGINPDILAAAALCDIEEIYPIGGAQAIAALAYGTETVRPVDKIVGPGNIYVATAKRLVYGTVDIDMITGPSEILILADGTADPAYLAADLLSQAEHDRMASAVLVTDSAPLLEAVERELMRQLETLPRREIAERSLADYGALIHCGTMEEAVAVANRIAPEHLEVMTADPHRELGRLDNAGSVFLGAYSPESLGDYFAGPNHVLPTGGTARFASPLSVDDFIKKSSFIEYTQADLARACADITRIARKEGLEAHARAAEIRAER